MEEPNSATAINYIQSYRDTGWEGPEEVPCVPIQPPRVDRASLGLPQQTFMCLFLSSIQAAL